MYRYLNEHGELYFIEIKDGDTYRPIGDVTFWQEDMPIVVGEKNLRGKKIGRRVVGALIDLTGWDTNTAEYSSSKGGFLTAAAISTAQNGQWVCSTLVGQTVGCVFKAPVVEFQSSFLHAGGFADIHQSWPAQIIEVAAAVHDVFVVDAVVENMV